MKVAEAARVLGLSLEDVTTDSLRQSFKKLTLALETNKARDSQTKLRYVQISEAYKKLSTIMEGKDNFRGDNSHEIAAFMRMFMDMVGVSDTDSLPAAAMTFGMMFGTQQPAVDEWSSDEDYDEDDDGEDDDDEDDEDEDEDDDGTGKSCHAKGRGKGSEEEKRLRMARKRAEKRKKQKCKKIKESYMIEEMIPAPRGGMINSEVLEVKQMLQPLSEEAIQDTIKRDLLHALELGREDMMVRVLGFAGDPPSSSAADAVLGLRRQLPLLTPVHRCITNFATETVTEEMRALAVKRLSVGRRLLSFGELSIDLNLYDDQGLSILHKSAHCADVNFVRFVLEEIAQRSGAGLNVNSRCRRKGWAALHYAVDCGSVETIDVLAGAGANLAATSATDKKLTPLELARQKAKALPSTVSSGLVDHLAALIHAQKGGPARKGGREDKTVEETTVKATGTSGEKAKDRVKEKDKKGKKKKGPEPKQDKEKAPSVEAKAATGGEEPVSAPVVAEPATAVAPSKASKGKAKGGGATPVPPLAPAPVVPTSEMAVSSRDELVDRLLGMGFAESDCLAAISRYGTDMDRAISWLCERPAVPTTPASVPPTPPAASVPAPAASAKTPSKDRNKAESKPSGTSSSGAGGSTPSKTTHDPEVALRLQREKEELRRINRAWNAKAEDDKRKLRQQAEEQRLRELEQKKAVAPAQNTAPVANSPAVDATLGMAADSSAIPIAPTLSWPTAAQAAALSVLPKAPATTQPQSATQASAPSPGISSGSGSANNSNRPSPRMDPQPAPFLPDPFVGGSFAPGIAVVPSFPYMPFGSFSGFAATGGSSFLGGDAVTSDDGPVRLPEEFVTGTIELSAGARPFVPKTFQPAPAIAPAAMPLSNMVDEFTPSPLLGASLSGAPAAPVSFGSAAAFSPAMSLGVSNGLWTGASAVSAASEWSSGIDMSGGDRPARASIPFGGLTGGPTAPEFNFLASGPLTLGADMFDFDVTSDIMPDLDSLLSHEDTSDLLS